MIATAEKKIVVRKAPAEKASTYEEGFIVAGTDGAMYVVKGYDNGIKRWFKVKKEKEETFHEASQTPTKRAYNKKYKPVMVDSETQTEEITPKKTAPKKERKAPAAPKKEKA